MQLLWASMRGQEHNLSLPCRRQKARKYHPDVNKEAGAEETFKQAGLITIVCPQRMYSIGLGFFVLFGSCENGQCADVQCMAVQISNAYEVLSDDQKKSIYDRCALYIAVLLAFWSARTST